MVGSTHKTLIVFAIVVVLVSAGVIWNDKSHLEKEEYDSDEYWVEYYRPMNEQIFNGCEAWIEKANKQINEEGLQIITSNTTKLEYFEIVTAINNAKIVDAYVKEPYRINPYLSPMNAFQFKIETTEYGVFATVQLLGVLTSNRGVVTSYDYNLHTERFLFDLKTGSPITDIAYDDITDKISLGDKYVVGWNEKYGMVNVVVNTNVYMYDGPKEVVLKYMEEVNCTVSQIEYFRKKIPEGAGMSEEAKNIYEVRIDKPDTYTISKVNMIVSKEIGRTC